MPGTYNPSGTVTGGGGGGSGITLDTTELYLDPTVEAVNKGVDRRTASRNIRDASGASTDMVASGDLGSATRSLNNFNLGSLLSVSWTLKNRWERFTSKGVGVAIHWVARISQPTGASPPNTIIPSYRLSGRVIRKEVRTGTTGTVDRIVETIPLTSDFTGVYTFDLRDNIPPNLNITSISWEFQLTFTTSSGATGRFNSNLYMTKADVHLVPVGTLAFDLATAGISHNARMMDDVAIRDELADGMPIRRTPALMLPIPNKFRRRDEVFDEVLATSATRDVDVTIAGGATWDTGLLISPTPGDLAVFSHDYTTLGPNVELHINDVKYHDSSLVKKATHTIDRGWWQPYTGNNRKLLIKLKNTGSSNQNVVGRHAVRIYENVIGPSGAGIRRGRSKTLASDKAFLAGQVGSADTIITWDPFSLYEADELLILLKMKNRFGTARIDLSMVDYFSKTAQDWDLYVCLMGSDARQFVYNVGRHETGAPTLCKWFQTIRMNPYIIGGTTYDRLCGGITIHPIRNAAGLVNTDMRLKKVYLVSK